MPYRDEIRTIDREGRWTLFKLLPLFLLAVFILFVVGFGLRSMGLIGHTVVERKVFEKSYQRSEGLKARIAIDEATLTEIQRKLSNPKLDESTRHNLEAQASAARLRIAAAKAQQ